MDELIQRIKACTTCAGHLPFPPKPVFIVHPDAKIAVIGQAPGRKVQESGIPWDDASGKELRRWLDVTPEVFYNPHHFAIVPMGFCFPGTGKSGDLPPRPECAPQWHPALFEALPNIQLTLLIGQYAQNRYLPETKKESLTDRVLRFREFLPAFLPLVHPSPRNKIWHKRNPWFETDLLPDLRNTVAELLGR